MAQIFLSYSRVDQLHASNLAKDLKDLGHAVWFDQDLSGGQAWWEQILARIRASDFFIFVLSSDALYSTACQREYGYAAELRRPILPVLVRDGLSLNVLPPALSQVQFLDFRERHIEAIIALSRALQSLPVGVPLPDPLPAPPEVPLSYFANLSQQIESTSNLSIEEQSRLVLELKGGLRDPATVQDARALLGRLRARRDLLATIAEEIDEVLVLEPKRPRMASQGGMPSLAEIVRREPRPRSAMAIRRGRFVDSGPDLSPSADLPSEDAKLCLIARQKIWLHWLLWTVPIVNLFTVFRGGALIQDPRLVRLAYGMSSFGYIAWLTDTRSSLILALLTSFWWGAFVSVLSLTVRIVIARKKLAALR
jgi:hypothetical protein